MTYHGNNHPDLVSKQYTMKHGNGFFLKKGVSAASI